MARHCRMMQSILFRCALLNSLLGWNISPKAETMNRFHFVMQQVSWLANVLPWRAGSPIQMVLDLQQSDSFFFFFFFYHNVNVICIQQKPYFQFWSFCRLVWCCASSERSPSQLCNPRVNNWYTYNHSVPIQPVSFSLSVQHLINYMNYSKLNYKVGFVLDDFAQLRVYTLGI